jgi:hypothetical protein
MTILRVFCHARTLLSGIHQLHKWIPAKNMRE